MKLIAYLFRVYIKSSVHIALAVSAMLFITIKSHHLDYDHSLFQLSFFGSIVAYNFIKYGLEVKRYYIKSKLVMFPIVVLTLLSAIMALLAVLELTYLQILLILIMGMLIYLYTIPFIPSVPNFRNLSRIKIYIVALVWAGLTLVLPLIEQWSPQLLVAFIQRLIFVLVLMIPFEIRDLKYDDASLKTLAQSLGIKGVKLLGYSLVVIWLILGLYLSVIPAILLLVVGLFLTLALVFSRQESKRLFTEFWVEGIPIAFAMVYALMLNY